MHAMHARTLAVFTPKGGTGKTSTVHSVAAALAFDGRRVLAVDLDSQGNLSYWLGHGKAETTLYDVVERRVTFAAAVTPTAIQNLDLIAAGPELAGAEGHLRASVGGELWLRRQIRTLPPNRWDWIILDCAPGLGILTICALVAADLAVSPAVPNVLDSAGIAQVLSHLEEVRETGLNQEVTFLGVVPIRVDKRLRVSRDVLEEMREVLGADLFDSWIPADVRMVEAPSHQVSIFEHAPSSRAARAYRDLSREIVQRAQDRSR